MKRIILSLSVACLLGLANTTAQAQSGVRGAKVDYENWSYIDAIRVYEKVVKRGYFNQEVLSQLGDSYYFNGRYAEAQPHYEKLFSEYGSENISPEYYYRYAETLQHVGQEQDAEKYYQQFVSKAGKTSQVGTNRSSVAEAKKQMQQNSGRYSALTNLPINTSHSDYGSYVADNTLYFTSARDTGSLVKRTHTWTGASFTNLYTHDLSSEKNAVKRVKGDVLTNLNEASAVVTSDGKTMYFTRNNNLDNKRKYDSNNQTHLKIYKATNEKGRWVNVVELPFNGDHFNTAHPALSADEKTLYFSSDRPGGYGESDIWKVAIHSSSYGSPVNLGPSINTEKRETFPFVSKNGELYFSSNGRVGFGGLDVYGAKIKADGFSAVQNLGSPINTNADDFAYYIDSSNQRGFLSSNREGGQGNDDIYSFVEDRSLVFECLPEVKITVVDSKTRNIIPDATVTLYDQVYNSKGVRYRYENNTYDFGDVYECGESYRIKVDKADYVTVEEVITMPKESGKVEKTIVLERKKTEVKEGDDLFKVLKLNPIYFDLDKDNIREDAAAELAKILAVMEEYPNMEIDVRSHTDSRASHKYNDELSERRAKSTAKWLMDQGIDKSRLSWKGYGERRLINECADGVNCSEGQHQENRRSEFIIKNL